MTRKYIDTKDTAKLIRLALAESFPGVKFSVRIDRYSMGSSIDISWTDGPTTKAVDAVVHTFKGDYYDCQSDYHGSAYHTLDGEPVHFAGSISTSRNHSAAAEAAIKGAWDKLEKWERQRLMERLDVWLPAWSRESDDAFCGVLRAWDFYGKPASPSATCTRVQPNGDDGHRS
jgi:conjugative element/phage-associated large polyvalent protein